MLSLAATIFVTVLSTILGTLWVNLLQGEVTHLRLVVLKCKIEAYLSKYKHRVLMLISFVIIYSILLVMICELLLNKFRIIALKNKLMDYMTLLYVILFIVVLIDLLVFKILIGAKYCKNYNFSSRPHLFMRINGIYYYILSDLRNDSYLTQTKYQINNSSNCYEIISPDKSIFKVYCRRVLYKSNRFIFMCCMLITIIPVYIAGVAIIIYNIF